MRTEPTRVNVPACPRRRRRGSHGWIHDGTMRRPRTKKAAAVSRDETSAKERAELARQQAEEARRSAARHAAARRAVQDSARRQVPDRRPPALSRKPGLEFRGGGISVDPTVTRTRPTPPTPEVEPAPERREAPPEPSSDNGRAARPRRTTPSRRTGDRTQPPATLRTLPPVARPRPPAATPPDTNLPTSTSAPVEEAPEPDLDEPTEQPSSTTAAPPAASTAAGTPAVADGQLETAERLGALTGLPTDIPALPDPPSQDAPEESVARGASEACLLYTSPSPRDLSTSRMPSSA